MSTLRVTFVCTGNICRSPAAHGVFEHALQAARARGERWADRVVVESAGVGGGHTGELPDPRAREEGAHRGYALDHRARRVASVDYEGLLIAMDRGHEAGLRRMAPPGFSPERLVLFRRFDPHARGDLDVADPYYDGDAAFVDMFNVIERSMPALLAQVKALAERYSP